MKIDILTLFPEMFAGPFDASILKRAKEKQLININIYNIRDFALDPHKTVDDSPYGGGPGMVMRVDVFYNALTKLTKNKKEKPYVILMTPQGKAFKQKIAEDLSKKQWLIIVCGHFEGYDERIRDYVDEEISLGDYVLTGGEIPAMAIVDSLVRLIPGVVGKENSLSEESFSNIILEYPHYTRPENFQNKKVPEVLLSGNHAEIAKWREGQAKFRTAKRRPDLL